jgi:hypothetical protein
VAHVLSAQETILASGGDATGSSGSSSYSVVQVFYNTNTSGTGSISQGVQQSVELFTLSNPELTALTLKVVTYPNPSTDYVVLSLSDANLTNLSYVLYDLQGRIVTKGQATQSSSQIAMHSLATGSYVLEVNQNNQ